MTHAIKGLSENDFICAAKVDALFDLYEMHRRISERWVSTPRKTHARFRCGGRSAQRWHASSAPA